jgi:hypothetical protein
MRQFGWTLFRAVPAGKSRDGEVDDPPLGQTNIHLTSTASVVTTTHLKTFSQRQKPLHLLYAHHNLVCSINKKKKKKGRKRRDGTDKSAAEATAEDPFLTLGF